MMRLGQENQSTGPILNRLLTQSVSTGKKVRSETNLGTGAVSISSAAVELAQLKIGQEKGFDSLDLISSFFLPAKGFVLPPQRGYRVLPRLSSNAKLPLPVESKKDVDLNLQK